MGRPKKSTAPKETAVSIIDRFVSEIPPQDLIILAAGAFAGSQGYTPLTAMTKIGTGVGGEIAELIARATKDPTWAIATGISPFGALVASWLNPAQASEVDEAHKDQFLAMMALASIGMIEAYTITRPGTLPALTKLAGDVVRATGEAVPF